MTDIFSIKNTLTTAFQKALESYPDSGVTATLEIPKEKGHGDFSSPVALALAKKLKKAPLGLAQEIASKLVFPEGFVAKTEVAPPGFINLTLDPGVFQKALWEALAADQAYGRNQQGKGQKILLEFVSANPTGPLNVVNARAAALGDSIANLLAASGWQVEREYYVNDAGVQARLFGESLWAAYQRINGTPAEAPEGGYQGAYMEDLAREIQADAEFNKRKAGGPEGMADWMGQWGMARVVEWHRKAMEGYGVHFDTWFSENQRLHQTGLVGKTVESLKQKGLTYEKEGALWIKTGEFGSPKDEVLVKGNGLPAYFAADIAYHLGKFDRGFDKILDIWGPDHHGHIQRMKSALQAAGKPVEGFTVLIAQQVNLLQGGEKVKMSKREGKFITMDELLEQVGKDAARFFFVMRSANSHLDFDIEVAQKQTDENPVYYIQYAHARISSLIRKAAAEKGFAPASDPSALRELGAPEEMALLREILEYPQWVEESGRSYEPHRIVAYLQNLAAHFHLFYAKHRILDSTPALGNARLALALGVKNVIRNALALLGVSAPESM
ncbi:MAG TPA: arginine--tRNA ligase [bacterium]|nr:arginine--tRNA ligase [bacterium]